MKTNTAVTFCSHFFVVTKEDEKMSISLNVKKNLSGIFASMYHISLRTVVSRWLLSILVLLAPSLCSAQQPTAYIAEGGRESPYYDDPSKLNPEEWRYELLTYSNGKRWGSIESKTLDGLERNLKADQKFARSYAKFIHGDSELALKEELNVFKVRGPIAVMKPGANATPSIGQKVSDRLHSLLDFAANLKSVDNSMKVMSGTGAFGYMPWRQAAPSYGKAFLDFLGAVQKAQKTIAKVQRAQSLGQAIWNDVGADLSGVLDDLEAASKRMATVQGVAAPQIIQFDQKLPFQLPSFKTQIRYNYTDADGIASVRTTRQSLSFVGDRIVGTCHTHDTSGNSTNVYEFFIDLAQAKFWRVKESHLGPVIHAGSLSGIYITGPAYEKSVIEGNTLRYSYKNYLMILFDNEEESTRFQRYVEKYIRANGGNP